LEQLSAISPTDYQLHSGWIHWNVDSEGYIPTGLVEVNLGRLREAQTIFIRAFQECFKKNPIKRAVDGGVKSKKVTRFEVG